MRRFEIVFLSVDTSRIFLIHNYIGLRNTSTSDLRFCEEKILALLITVSGVVPKINELEQIKTLIKYTL